MDLALLCFAHGLNDPIIGCLHEQSRAKQSKMPKHGPFIRQYNLKGVQSLYFGINSGQRSSGHTRLRSVPYPHKTQSRNLGMLGSCSVFSVK